MRAKVLSATEAESKIANSTVTVEAPSAFANAKLPDGTPALKFELNDRVLRVLGVPANYGLDDVRYLFRGFESDSCVVVPCPDGPMAELGKQAEGGGQKEDGGQKGSPKKGGTKLTKYPHATYLVQFREHEDQQMAIARINLTALGGNTVKLVSYK